METGWRSVLKPRPRALSGGRALLVIPAAAECGRGGDGGVEVEAGRGDRACMHGQRVDSIASIGPAAFSAEVGRWENRRAAGRVHAVGTFCSLGEVVDVSATGMRVRARAALRLAAGQRRQVTMAVPAGLLSLEVEVAWVRRRGRTTGGREVGVRFIGVTPEVAQGLTSVLHRGAVGPIELREMERRRRRAA